MCVWRKSFSAAPQNLATRQRLYAIRFSYLNTNTASYLGDPGFALCGTIGSNFYLEDCEDGCC